MVINGFKNVTYYQRVRPAGKASLVNADTRRNKSFADNMDLSQNNKKQK